MSIVLRRLLALLLLVAAAPVVLMFVAGIQMVSPGQPFFRQSRVGLHGKVFRMWKLRTMQPAAESRLRELLQADPQAAAQWGAYGRLRMDPRVVEPFGRWARQSSIDELPQLINVLCGQMAFIGPRPLPPDQATAIESRVRALRESVLPGMTGLWQVRGRSETTLRQMIRLDLIYLRRRTVLLDLYVLLRTPHAIISSRGAY